MNNSQAENKFIRILRAFWSSLVEEYCNTEYIYEKNHRLLDHLIEFLTSISSAESRIIRYLASIVVFNVASALLQVARKLERQNLALERQLSSENENVSRAKLHDLRKQRTAHQQRYQRVFCMVMSIYNGVLAHRLRDISPVIRILALEYLQEWIKILPKEFSSSNHIRHFGCLLNDKDFTVRRKCVLLLEEIYALDVEIDLFTAKYAKRIIEMCHDSDIIVAENSLRLLCTIDKRELLPDDDLDDIDHIEELLFYGRSPQARRYAGNFVSLQYHEFGLLDGASVTPTAAEVEAHIKEQIKAMIQLSWKHLKEENPKYVEYMVDAFWKNSDCGCLHDWQSLISFALSDHKLSAKEQLIFFHILLSCSKLVILGETGDADDRHIAFTLDPTSASSKKSTKRSNPDTEEAQMLQQIVSSFGLLLRRYRSDSDVLTIIVQLLKYVVRKNHSFPSSESFENILRQLKDVYLNHQDSHLLGELAFTWYYISHEGGVHSYQVSQFLKDLYSELWDYLHTFFRRVAGLKVSDVLQDEAFSNYSYCLRRFRYICGYIITTKNSSSSFDIMNDSKNDAISSLQDFVSSLIVDQGGSHYSIYAQEIQCVLTEGLHVLYLSVVASFLLIYNSSNGKIKEADAATQDLLDDCRMKRDGLASLITEILSCDATGRKGDPTFRMVKATAFRIFCDFQRIFSKKYQDAIEPFNSMFWSPRSELFRSAQEFFESEMLRQLSKTDVDKNEYDTASMYSSLVGVALNNPENYRQSSSVLFGAFAYSLANDSKNDTAIEDICEVFMRRQRKSSLARYFQIQMVTIRTIFEDALLSDSIAKFDAFYKFCRKLVEELGKGNLNIDQRLSLANFIKEAITYAFKKIENLRFLGGVTPYLGHLSKNNMVELSEYFLECLERKIEEGNMKFGKVEKIWDFYHALGISDNQVEEVMNKKIDDDVIDLREEDDTAMNDVDTVLQQTMSEELLSEHSSAVSQDTIIPETKQNHRKRRSRDLSDIPSYDDEKIEEMASQSENDNNQDEIEIASNIKCQKAENNFMSSTKRVKRRL